MSIGAFRIAASRARLSRVLSLALFSAVLMAAQPSAAAEAGLRVDAGLFAALPTVLGTGQLLGPVMGARWDLDDWSFGLKARLGFTEENDLVWRLSHTELRVSLGAAHVWRIGRGAISLGASAGGLLIYESRLRHQADRLGAVGLVTEDSALASGPFAALDLGARVYFYDPLWMGVEGGPTVALVQVGDELQAKPGWMLGISFGYAFGR